MSFQTQECFCYSLIGTEPANFTESVFPAFVSYVFAPEFFFFLFNKQPQTCVENIKEASDDFQGICSTLWTNSDYSSVEWMTEWAHNQQITRPHILTSIICSVRHSGGHKNI